MQKCRVLPLKIDRSFRRNKNQKPENRLGWPPYLEEESFLNRNHRVLRARTGFFCHVLFLLRIVNGVATLFHTCDPR